MADVTKEKAEGRYKIIVASITAAASIICALIGAYGWTLQRENAGLRERIAELEALVEQTEQNDTLGLKDLFLIESEGYWHETDASGGTIHGFAPVEAHGWGVCAYAVYRLGGRYTTFKGLARTTAHDQDLDLSEEIVILRDTSIAELETWWASKDGPTRFFRMNGERWPNGNGSEGFHKTITRDSRSVPFSVDVTGVETMIVLWIEEIHPDEGDADHGCYLIDTEIW